MTRVSVVIPTCNRPALLERALQSVCSQERMPDEILVVDDGALPAHGAVEKFAARGAHLLANAGRKGPSGARNTGAARASGTLLAFLDDDDEWLPTYLAEAVRRVEADVLDVMCTDLLYRYDDGSEQPGKNAPDALVVDSFLVRNPGLIGSNLIIRPALYRAIGGFDETLRTSEDMDFGIRLSLQPAVRYAPLRERLVRHYQHGSDRLCTRQGEAMRAGIRRFFELHGERMNDGEREHFRNLVRELWGVDEYGSDAHPPADSPPC